MNLTAAFAALLVKWRDVLPSDKGFLRVVHVLVGMLCAAGRHTVTGSIRFRGRQQQPWSADYAAFSRASWDPAELFGAAFAEGVRQTRQIDPDGPIVVALDDTSAKKSGKAIAAARWMKDPLSPKFTVNLMFGLRFLHSALILPLHRQGFAPRAISIGFDLAPAPKKPGRKGTEADWTQYRYRQKSESLTMRAASVLARHRTRMDELGLTDRTLLSVGDGGYTNRTLLGNLPERTQFIGRVRKDIAICRRARPGGRKVYGERLPTPEQMRSDPEIPYLTATFFYGGAEHEIRYKDIPDVLWQGGTKRRTMRVLILAPTRYRAPFRSGRKYNYNDPAYLITTDLDSRATVLVQAVLDRWQIEPLHRDLKSGLGLGQAQTWSPKSVARIHTAVVATWSLLTLAALNAYGLARTQEFGPLPAWRRVRANHRASQGDILERLRTELDSAHKRHSSVSPPTFPTPTGIVPPTVPPIEQAQSPPG